MPMNWDAEANAKLLAAIFKVCNVKPTSAQLAEVASIMGPDCTAKAITHQISKMRNASGASGDGEGSAKKPKATKGGAKRKKAAAETGSDDEEAATGSLTPPDSNKKKRVNKAQLMDGIKVGEDIGEGLRSIKREEEDDEV